MASWVGGRSTATPSQLESVVRAIHKTPIIDNHAHPLLIRDALSKYPLLSITTEAGGEAIHAATASLAHLRGVKQLASVLKCEPTWEAVVAAIEQKRIHSPWDWTAQCLAGIETILVDDGLDDPDEAQEYSWHDDYTRSECKRIVRVEKVAAVTIAELGAAGDGSDSASASALETLFDKVLATFTERIQTAVDDPEVVGFKSVICYRTGLDIPGQVSVDEARKAFVDMAAQFIDNHGSLETFSRLQHVHLNDLIVHRTAQLIAKSSPKKPLQFHTGLGDNDITLTSASPAHLQEFIRAYPTVPIVLLHASYPFMREAGYLATVYDNVYADIGEVFPFVSQDGQERVVRQILELCPWSKILWSTDGHWFPETYLLAIMQMREVLQTVLLEYIRKGHLGWRAAVELVRDILFHNSNKLYHLELEFEELEEEVVENGQMDRYISDLELLDIFLRDQPRPDFVQIHWTDYTASVRMRMVPFRKFISLLNEGNPTDIGVTKAAFGIIQNDWTVPGTIATGEYRLHPDFSSLRRGPIEGHISMYGEFREKSGAAVSLCPRTLLQRAVGLGAEHKLSFLLGFEVEFLLLDRLDRGSQPTRYATLQTDGHAWSMSRAVTDPKLAKLLKNMVSTLEEMDIYVEQIHAESATGQFELVLPPLPPVQAVDTLLHTRDAMAALASAAGYRMTLTPKPFPMMCGTGAHTHMSISSPNGSKPEVYQAYYAGVLKHLRAITAFTYSNRMSYERVADGVWAGGRWVAWGTQNRETALRKIEDSHWELKCMDGLANPYLAMAAILFAGIHGVAAREKLVQGDCEIDPGNLTENDRAELRITEMLPASLEEALAALKDNEDLGEWMGPEVVEKYAAVKEFELNFLGGMSDEEQRQWIMERY
ncbi:glutamine synthetase/guanido kinase [Thozetella sp. PMI_491]|nr:glutamine synthetase/guanido kinase [Thozetella sp. PMI_491]